MNNYSLKKSFFVCLIAVFLILFIQNQISTNNINNSNNSNFKINKYTPEQSLDDNIEILNGEDSSFNLTTISKEDDELQEEEKKNQITGNKINIVYENEDKLPINKNYKDNVLNSESSQEEHGFNLNNGEDSSKKDKSSTVEEEEEEEEDSSNSSSDNSSNLKNGMNRVIPQFISKEEAEYRKLKRIKIQEENEQRTKEETEILRNYVLKECRNEMKAIIKNEGRMKPLRYSALPPIGIEPLIALRNESDYVDSQSLKMSIDTNPFLLPKPHIFLHLPKTAGTSLKRTFLSNNRGYKLYHSTSHPQFVELRRIVVKDTLFGHFRFGLHKYYEDRLMHPTNKAGYIIDSKDLTESQEIQFQLEKQEREKKQLEKDKELEIMNNIYMNGNNININNNDDDNGIIIEPVKLNEYSYLTMLRDPIERVISHYYFLKESLTHPLHNETINKTLLEWASLSPVTNNEVCRRIVGIDRNTIEPIDFAEQCIHRLKFTFKYIGIMERFDESIVILSHKLGYKNLLFITENVGKVKLEGRISKETLTPEELSLIKRINYADMVAYDIALEIFEKQLDAIGRDYIQQEVISLKNDYIERNGKIETRYINDNRERRSVRRNTSQQPIFYVNDEKAKEQQLINQKFN